MPVVEAREDIRKRKKRHITFETTYGQVKIVGNYAGLERNARKCAQSLDALLKREGMADRVFLVVGFGKEIRAGYDIYGRPYISIGRDLLRRIEGVEEQFMEYGFMKLKEARREKRPREVSYSFMDGLERKEIDLHVRAWLSDPERLRRVLNRAERLVDFISKELNKRDVPVEFTLLPAVESSFVSKAISSKGAAGIWQFMPETAKDYGLVAYNIDKKEGKAYDKNGNEVPLEEALKKDQRFNIRKSTEAAAKHLARLSSIFNNDYAKVLAAYNAGENAVKERLGNKSFWNGYHSLPDETRQYVPSFYALLEVVRNSEMYGVNVPPKLKKALEKELLQQKDRSVSMPSDTISVDMSKEDSLATVMVDTYGIRPGL